MKLPLEHTLYSALKNGSRKAFQTLFDSYYDVLCIFAMKYLKDTMDAQDVVQETFIALWNSRQKYASDTHIKSFLYLTVKNKCLNLLKHQKVQEEYSSQNAEETEERYFEENLLQVEVLALLRNAIRRLPEKRQEVILLSLQGMRNEEIAENMGVSVNTVKLQKKHAYEYLRKQLKEVFFLLFL